MDHAAALTDGHRAFLQDLFGENVSFEKNVLRVYSSDASLASGEVFAMVRPVAVSQVTAFMRWAGEERIAVHPRGRGTSLSGGCVPTTPGIVLSTLGLDRILDISPADFVAEVEPGVCTAALQTACEKLGLMYPPDPASGKATSVGGNVSTCAGGLKAVKYGVTRDYVIGCDVVLPGGKLLTFGGRAHKDVVGLDLARLMAGSEGTLGIITKLYLKLLPKPEASASILVGYPSLDAALLSMGKVFSAGVLPTALEFMGETLLEVLRRTGNPPWPDTINSLLLFQLDGSRESMPLEIARLGRQLEGALWQAVSATPEEEDALWAHRRRASSAAYIMGPDRIGGDLAVPRGQLLPAVRRFESIARENGKRVLIYGHAGDGNIHANLHYDASDPDDAERTMKTHHGIDEAALEFGGSISGEHGCGSLKNVGLQLRADERELMRAVRRIFDPNGILNPNKAY